MRQPRHARIRRRAPDAAGAGPGLLRPLPAAAAGGRFQRSAAQGLGAVFHGPGRSGHRVGHQADADRGLRLRAAEPCIRPGGVLADRQARVPRQAAADHADRPAVLGVPGRGRPDVRADLRRPGLVRPVAAGARPEDRLRRARHRAGHRVRDLPVRRPRADPADAGPGQGRGGSRHRAGRQRLGDLPPRHAAQHQVGPAVRRHPLQRTRHGRVWRGVGRLRPHPRHDEYAAAARRDPLQRIPVRRRLRRGLGAGAAGAGDAGDQAIHRVAR
ncbi:unnamed protein product [Rotaria sp. Silwood1]|nr:unnamed protein product [Rotaria sp. Silwood1]